MLISTKGRYALRVMIDLAEHNSGEYIPLKEIADRQNISKKYLESIIALLVKENFLDGLRGKGGGYRLVKEPEKYSVRSILLLTEGTLAPVSCLTEESHSCERAYECRTLPMWTKLNSLINDYLESVSIADLSRSSELQNDYSI